MKFFSRTVVTLSIVSGLLLSLVLVSTVLASNDSQNIKTEKLTNNFLQTANRKNILTVCVESYSSNFSKTDAADTANNKVLDHIEKDLKVHPRWEVQGLDKFAINVKRGCSFKPSLIDPTKNHVFFSGDLDSMNIVTESSPERIGVFIVEPEIIEKHFQGTVSRLAPEEFIIDEERQEALEVTTGLYLTEDEFKEEEILHQLNYVFGLEILEFEIKKKNQCKLN